MQNKQWPDIPEPSKLYSLKPIGVGTPETESLTSYVMRLAEAHSVDVCYLIHRFIYPILKEKKWKDPLVGKKGTQARKNNQYCATPTQLEISAWLDMTERTQATVDTLSDLTKRSDLHWLTLLPLRGYVQQEGILRSQKAWCRLCYEDQKDAGAIVYDLLAWSFQEIRVCAQHKQILWSQCYWCNARQPILKSLSQPGICSKCGEWLGSKHSHLNEVRILDLWKAQDIENVIANWVNLPPGQCKKPPVLRDLLNRSFGTGLQLQDIF